MRQLMIAMLCVTTLSACASDGKSTKDKEQAPNLKPTLSESPPLDPARIDQATPLGRAAYWGSLYDKTPINQEIAGRFADSLIGIGKHERAAEVASLGLAHFPNDALLLRSQGRARIALGQGAAAIAPLSRALAQAPTDWRLMTAMGVAYDQMGDTRSAMTKHNQALALAPDEPDVLGNIAFSYAMSGELDQAETYMRRAATSPKATTRDQVNLGYILGLVRNQKPKP